MGFQIAPSVKKDILDAFIVGEQAFAKHNDALYSVLPISPESRERVVASFLEFINASPHTKSFKAVDDETGKLVAQARWSTHTEDEVLDKTVEEVVAARLRVDVPERRDDVARLFYTLLNEGKREVMGVPEEGEEGEEGKTTVNKLKKRVELESCFTHPDYQGRGIASLFLGRVCQEADELGLVAYLEATSEGRPVYEKFGFEAVKLWDFDSGVPGKKPQLYTFMVRQPQTASSERNGATLQ